ncbi:MAG: 23S rRNA (uracil(1939)-C(5))-methyltransferase RlmD, partial [Bacteroidota bacterium]
ASFGNIGSCNCICKYNAFSFCEQIACIDQYSYIMSGVLKLEYTFSSKRWLSSDEIGIPDEIKNLNALGFHIPGKFDKILDIDLCYLQPDPSNAIRLEVKKYAGENDFEFYDIKGHKGYLRNLIIRNSLSGQLMVIFVFNYEDIGKQGKILNHIAKKFPEITSLMNVVNPKNNDIISDLEVRVHKGTDYIIEEMGNLKFKIGPKSFFQTNSTQAQRLYEIVIKFAQLQADDIVYDLYTGTGTIANFIAESCKKVVGIEYMKDAIEDAKLNAQLNNIQNAIFFSGDIKDVLNDEFISENGKPSVMITDPPRNGMHKDVIDAILKIKPGKIVYVSCNPATQARDIALFSDCYFVADIQPIDMFPQTHHVENVVLLKNK